MANSIRQKIYTQVVNLIDALQEDGELGDYTIETTPVIRDDMADAFGQKDEVSIWIDYGSEEMEPDATHIGDKSHRVALTVQVNILVRKRAGTTLATEANNALQDVRNVIHLGRAAFKSAADADWVGFGDCTTDEGSLSFENMTLIVQDLVFSYAGGPTW